MISSSAFPSLRLEIEGVREHLITALTKYEGGIVDAVRSQIEAQLTPENIERMVAAAVREELPRIIRGVVSSALSKVQWDEQVGALMFDAIGKVLQGLKNTPQGTGT